MENAQRMSSHPEGSKVGFASYLQREQAHDWIVVEVSHTLLEECSGIVGNINDSLDINF